MAQSLHCLRQGIVTLYQGRQTTSCSFFLLSIWDRLFLYFLLVAAPFANQQLFLIGFRSSTMLFNVVLLSLALSLVAAAPVPNTEARIVEKTTIARAFNGDVVAFRRDECVLDVLFSTRC
ncbi:hypothetical protein DFH07DRAFT_335787 [Mycena maculata]|uniref:Uncharacterized protein n=1 Tax=Mycena maculata TaxID=230809 RepID=A0AAD7NM58_9AGAR|nr:hypothetical protein DFH07DRAFT_335787 [Mycena maculata]